MEKKVVALFDCDGTLTPARNPIKANMLETLRKLKEKAIIAVVGGSDYHKVIGQLGDEGVKLLDYLFTENGLIARKGDQIIGQTSISDALGEDKLKEFINFCLKYLSEIDIPIKRGTFIEYRTGMMNISPIGRNCSQKERDEFEIYDHEHKIRQKFIGVLQERFKHFNLKYSIGGQISFDVFPIGWDKTYCLKYLEDFKEIHFFGDKTTEGGNDYEIYISDKVKGHSVKNPEETIALLEEIFKL